MSNNNHPMRSMQRTLVLLALLMATEARAIDLSDYPEVEAFIATVADKHEFAAPELRRWFRRVQIRPEIIEAMVRPKEALPWYEYKKIFLTEENLRQGTAFWKKHASALARAQEQYQVPAEIILAILGVETQYGANKGAYPVLDALTTLMLNYPPRADFFRGELEEFLLLAREMRLDPSRIKGSYAGAMGWGQFIPSSYRRYAVDFDGDGRRDILNNPEDAIGSVANYLKVHGWQANQPICDNIQLEGTLYFWIEKLGIKPTLRVRHLIPYGIFPEVPRDADERAALIALEGESGPLYRVAYDNFYVITRYNRSKRYAMAVYELGEMLRKRHEGEP